MILGKKFTHSLARKIYFEKLIDWEYFFFQKKNEKKKFFKKNEKKNLYPFVHIYTKWTIPKKWV